VLSGVAEYTTALACRYAADAERIGLDGLMVLPAMVYKSDPRETIAHFRPSLMRQLTHHVLQQSGLLRRRHNPEMFAELADEPKLVAIKEFFGERSAVSPI